MNPYLIIAAIAVVVGSWVGGNHVGHIGGMNEQKVADQARFDEINAEISQQKAEASEKYRTAQENNLALMTERDQLKTTLGKEHEQNRVNTAALRDKYAGTGLRYTNGTGSGVGAGGISASGSDNNPASASGSTVLQLPDAIGANLRQLAFDADTLADSYRECYGYAQQVR